MTVFYQEKNINGLKNRLTFRPLKRRTWLMVPLHKEITIECIVPKKLNLIPRIRHENISELNFNVNNSNHRIVTITLKGLVSGKTFIDWHDKRGNFNPGNSLILSCKKKIRLNLSFHYLRGQAAATERNKSDLLNIVKVTNELLFEQANIECRIKNFVDLTYPANADLDMGKIVGGGETRAPEGGRIVDHVSDKYNHYLPKDSECIFLFSFGDSTADINIFFVKALEIDETPNLNNAVAVTYPGFNSIIIEDNLENTEAHEALSVQITGEILAHEIGHVLGLSIRKIINGVEVDTHHKEYGNLMHKNGGQYLTRWQINRINRTGLRKPRLRR